ncbi:trichohyalin-like isoform X1, partial [Brachionus plicatilis]
KFGRYVSKDGYIDSNQTIHRANLKQGYFEKRRSSSESGMGGQKKSNVRIELSSVDIAGQEVEKRKKNEKHLKVIEDQMIQSKQEERGFKREEGDVKKEQRQIRQAVREFDGLISKKRLDADKSLAKNLEERKVLEIENAHKKEKVSRII